MADPTQPTPLGFLSDILGIGQSKTAEKKASVAEAAEAKKQLLSGQASNRTLAIAAVEGNDAGQSEMAQDLANGYMGDVAAKYGSDVAMNLPALQSEITRYKRDKVDGRDTSQVVGDAALGGGAAFVDGIGGILSLGMGAFSAKQGAHMAETTKIVTDAIRGNQSDDLARLKALGAVRGELDRQDNQTKYEADVAAGDSYAGLKRFGREVLSSAGDLYDNPALAVDLTAEGSGSLITGLGLGKAASLGAAKLLLKSKGIVGEAATTYLKSPVGKKLLGDLTEKGMPLSIGLQEAGGTYTGIQAEIQAMGESELSENSPEYNELRRQGMSHEEARDTLANEAGLKGGALQGVIGAATGTLVAKIEANPLKVSGGSLTDGLEKLGKDVLKEGVEEGAQGVSGSLASNFAIQQTADQNRDLTEGLGSDLVQSVVAGSGLASVTNTPNLVDTGLTTFARNAGSELATIGRGISGVIDGRAEAAEAKNDAASPVGQDATTKAAETAQTTITNTVEKLKADTTVDPTSAPVQDFQTRMSKSLDLDQNELDTMPEAVREMIAPGGARLPEGQSAQRYAATDAVIKALKAGVDAQTRKDAILWLHEQASLFEAVKDADLTGLPDWVSDEHRQGQEQLDTIRSNPLFKKAEELAPTLEMKDLGSLPEINETTVDTPEVRQAVGRVVQLAHANPTALDPTYGRMILNQAATGKLPLEERVRQRLETAIEIAELFQSNEANKLAMVNGLSDEEGGLTVGTVKKMILSDGNKNDMGQFSLREHVGRILAAARAGNTSVVQSLMGNLQNFAEHMQNKVSAANESLKRKPGQANKVPYRTWTGSNWVEPGALGSGDIFVNPRSENSLATGKAVLADADTVLDIYNTLARGLSSVIQADTVDAVDPDQRLLTEPSKERRLRKDAVVKAEESLVEQEPKTLKVTPRRPERVKREAQGPVQKTTETFEFAGVTYGSVPMEDASVKAIQLQLAEDLGVHFEGAEKLIAVVENWVTLSSDDPGLFGGFANYTTRTIRLIDRTLKGILNRTGAMARFTLLHELGHLLDADMFFQETSADGNQSHARNFWDPERPVGKEIQDILENPKHLFHNFLQRYAATFEGDIRKEEIFAELIGLFLKNQSKFKEVAPNVHAYFAERLSQTYGVTLRTEAAPVADGASDAGRNDPVPSEAGRGAAAVNGSVPQEATEKAEASPQEEAGEDRSAVEGADTEGQPEGAEEAGPGGTEDGGAQSADAPASAGPGRVTNPFTNLVKSAKGVVRFVQAYTIDDTKSPLVTSGSPIETVLDSLNNFEAHREDLFVDYELDAEQKEALSDLVQTEVRDMVDALNAKLLVPQKTLKGADKELLSPLDALAYGQKDFTGFREARALNLVDETTGEYDAILVQLAALAALNWAMNANPAKIPDAEDVAKMFGVAETEVTGEMMQASRNAVSGSLAVESLGREIMEFWGAKANGKAPMSDTLGIAQGMASELLSVMRGRITVESTIDIERDGKTLTAVAIKTSHPNTEERIKKISYARTYLKEAFVKQAEKAVYFDEPPAQVRKKQKRNMIGNLGSKMQKALRRHQEQKFYRNTPFVGLMQALGQDLWMDLMGHQKVIPELMNHEHRLSVEGKNTQIQKSWEGVMEHNMRLEAHATRAGKNPDDVVTHYDVYAVSNERIHQDGFAPQSNKTQREASVSTVSTLDLDNADHRHKFWLTVGQSSGLVKTEIIYGENEDPTQLHAQTAAKTEKMVEAKYGKAIEALRELVRVGTISNEDRQTFADAVRAAGGTTDKVIHSILAVARYKHALESNNPTDRNEFKHMLSLEADGKTDGPMAALVNHARGLFSVAEIRNFRRGGFFLGQKDRTLNDQFQNNKADKDLYSIASDGTVVFLKARIAEMREKAGTDHVEAMMRFVSHFSKDLSWNAETGEITIGRGFLKNPLTVSVYGSGANGIADKISGALLEAFYERMTELELLRAEKGDQSLTFAALPGMEDYADVIKDLQTLATSRILFNKDQDKFYTSDVTKKRVKAPLKLVRPRDFKLSPQNREMLSHNLRQILVNPMRQGIGQVMANPQAVNELLQKATQLQSQVMMAHFRKAVKDTLAEKRASGELEKGEFLSQDDYNEIYRKASRFGAVIEPSDSNENHLNLSGSESVKSSYEFTRSLEGEYGGGTRLPEPTDAGVSASAMMTISRGDAMMMVNYFVSEDPDLRTLAVFDGLEMPADGITKISEKINKAVAEAWLSDNGPQDLADSFADFTRQGKEGPFAGLPVEDLKAIAESQRMDEMADVQLQSRLSDLVQQISEQLATTAQEIQARKNAMKSMEYSMDHMASGRAPHNNEGEAFDADPSDPNYDDKLVGWLNLRYEEELAKLSSDRKAQLERPSVEKPSAAFAKKVKEHGVEMGYRPITRMTTKALARMMQSETVSKDARDVFQVIQKALPNFTFLFGSSEELTAYRDETYPDLVGLAPVQMGQADIPNRVVYIANAASETVLHEALHTATLQLVHQFYADPAQLDGVQRAAVSNLEKLMTQFLDMDFRRTFSADLEQDEGAALNVAQVIQRQVVEHLSHGDTLGRAVALNEFMAWSLSNQNLVDVMRKTKVRTPLSNLVFKATAWIRKLLGLPNTQKLDMFSNILQNTGALVRGGTNTNATLPAGVVVHQMTGQPVDTRLQRMMEKFETKVASHLRKITPRTHPGEEVKIKDNAHHALSHFQFHGFDMDVQQASAFKTIQVALASTMQLDNRALVQAQRIFSHVTKQLSPKDFEGYPDGNLRSQSRFNMLMGEYGWETDLEGRSNVLASFLALSQVDLEFRRVLDGIDLPKDRSVSYASTDEFLTSLANSTLDTLATTISGGGLKSRTTREALDRLSLVLGEIETDDRLWIEKKTQGFLDQADGVGAKYLSTTGERLSAWADQKSLEAVGQVRSRTKELIRGGASVLGSLLNEQRGAAMSSAMVSTLNQAKKVPAFLTELMVEAVGMTDENRGVTGLINKVKAGVSAMRQDYREEVPKIIAEKFSRELTEEEWSAMHLVYGKTDSGVLQEVYGDQARRRMVTDKRYLENVITEREEELKVTSKAWATYQRKAKELARFMVKGEVQNNNLLRNATTIAALMGEPGKGTDDAGTIQLIDILTTLYALELVDQEKLDLVSNLADTEAEGIDFLSGYLWSVRADELSKIQTDAAKFNHYKGYIPSERREGISLKVADDSEHNSLIAMGYTRMGDYKGAGVESGKMGYYFSTVSGNGTYTQGVMQTIQQSASGVDPRTGRSIMGTTAGVISGKYLGIIQQRLRNAQRGPVEALLPVYDAKGQITAYERHMAPHALAALERNTHMGEMLGAWAGRQAEEELGGQYNRMLVDNLKKIWDRDKAKRSDEFVDLSDADAHKDRVYADSWEMVPNDLRDYIKEVFGEDGFPIRKDMINNAVGYRAASITDAWTGISRMSDEHQKAFVKIVTAIHGDAYTYLATAEKAIQAGVSVVKSTIVVRSIIIPMANLASNFLQLSLQGVSIRDMVSGYQTKLVEITKYQKNLKRAIDIKAEITAQRNNHDAVRRLETELRSLEDSNKRMSIWPLVKAGEFATISEGITEADAALAQGKWAQYIQGLMDKIPAKAGTIGRYAFVTRDTALFQGMARAMQYGDFLSKAVLYDHLSKQGKTADEAMKGVTEEFVNYNLLPGRTRTALDNMGLTWFWAFKIRSIKVALQHIRHHPFRALMLSMGNPMIPDVPGLTLGSPIDDNMLSVVGDGRLGYSIGPGMAFNAPSLHPWVNLVN